VFPSGSIHPESRLSRSKDADFDLSVNQTSGFNFNVVTDDLEALLDTLPRCRGLWISCQDPHWLHYLCRLVLRRLEYIFIKIHSPSGELHLRNAPRLRAVQLHLVHPLCLSLFDIALHSASGFVMRPGSCRPLAHFVTRSQRLEISTSQVPKSSCH